MNVQAGIISHPKSLTSSYNPHTPYLEILFIITFPFLPFRPSD